MCLLVTIFLLLLYKVKLVKCKREIFASQFTRESYARGEILILIIKYNIIVYEEIIIKYNTLYVWHVWGQSRTLFVDGNLLRKTNNELASLLIAILLETVLDAGLVSKWSINQSTVNAFFEWTSEKKWIRRESRVVDEVNNSKTPINILRAKG